MGVIRALEQNGKYKGSAQYLGPGSASRTWAVDVDPAGPVLSSFEVIAGAQALAGSTVPDYGDELDPAFPIIAKDFTCDEDGNCWTWILTVLYSPSETNPDQDPEELPTSRPAALSWNFENYEKVLDEDTLGNAYVNSTGDPFDIVPVFTGSYAVLNVTQYESAFSGVGAGAFSGTINDAAFQGADAYTLKFRLGNATQGDVEGQWLWTITYQLIYNPDKWNPVKVLDQGPRVLEGGDPVLAKDANNIPTGKIVRLDGSGAEVPPAGASSFIDFYPYKETDFSTIGMRF